MPLREILELRAVGPVDRDAPPYRDEPDDVIARDRVAALREMREEIADPVDAYLGSGARLPRERLCRGIRLLGLVSAVARENLTVSLLAAPRVLESGLE